MAVENVKCPKCGGPMTSRLNKKRQTRFWGCNQFPRCNGTLNTDGEVSSQDHSQRPARDFDGSDGGELPSERQAGNDRARWRD